MTTTALSTLFGAANSGVMVGNSGAALQAQAADLSQHNNRAIDYFTPTSSGWNVVIDVTSGSGIIDYIVLPESTAGSGLAMQTAIKITVDGVVKEIPNYESFHFLDGGTKGLLAANIPYAQSLKLELYRYVNVHVSRRYS